ncbi:MAG: amidohydrolase family protein [Vicinamibacteria bacterium]
MDKERRLLVDPHCHVFSGRDIPLAEFLYYGREIPWGLAYFVEWLATHPAATDQPGASRIKKAKSAAMSAQGLQSDFQEAEERNLLERFAAYADLMSRPVKAITARMLAELKAVDLFTPAITDMDCWLGDASFYDDRVAEHGALAREDKFKGRVHPIVGFDPVRQHATRLAFGAGKDHLEQVRKAVEEDGFVGVKVYPPMGYRPARNAEYYKGGAKVRRPDGKPVRCKLAKNDKSVEVDMTGADLDEAMDQLFKYCVAADVPVMAHCTHHGAEASRGRGYHSDPRFWRTVLTKFNALRLNLGHFGGDTGRPSFLPGAVQLAVDFPNVYGDVGAHDLVNPGARSAESYSYEMNSAREEGLDWRKKIMFGTDWHTTYVQASPGAYVGRYLKFFDEELSGGDASVKTDFRSANALRFLGLARTAPNNATRKRLEAFYKKHELFKLDGADAPAWW